MRIIIFQSIKIKTTWGNRYTSWDWQAALPLPEQHEVHLLLFFHKQPTHNSWQKVHTGPSPTLPVTALPHPTPHLCCSCPPQHLWGCVAGEAEQQEQIHHRNRGCRTVWQSSGSSCGRGTHSCTIFHHHHLGIQVKVSASLNLPLLSVAISATGVSLGFFSSISASDIDFVGAVILFIGGITLHELKWQWQYKGSLFAAL